MCKSNIRRLALLRSIEAWPHCVMQASCTRHLKVRVVSSFTRLPTETIMITLSVWIVAKSLSFTTRAWKKPRTPSWTGFNSNPSAIATFFMRAVVCFSSRINANKLCYFLRESFNEANPANGLLNASFGFMGLPGAVRCGWGCR